MAARKKASKKGSGTVTKKTKAPVGSTTSRKRKASAAASASRRTTTAKAKAARSAKAKADKSEAKRRAAASAAAKRRERSASAAPAAKPVAAKAGKAAVTKPAVNEAAKSAMVKPAVAKPTIEAKAPRVAAQAPRPAAVAPAKPAAPLAKRAPFAVRARPVDVAASIETESVAVRAARPASGPRQGFKVSEFVVYPAHGVELFVINFAKDKMTLRVPTSKVVGVGMRKLSDPDVAKKSLEILTGRARIKRTMWSRRAQEYEAKINSGDINAIAEVVRDLYRSEAQPEQSYSERQLYEAALDRIMREIAAVQKLSEIDALKLIESHLKRSQRRAAKADAAEGDEAVEEAA